MPVRAALWAARAAQCGRGLWERGRGKEGGREEAGRGVWMLVRQRRPACSQLLPECERRRESEGGGQGGREEWGGLAGHQAGQFEGRACISFSTR